MGMFRYVTNRTLPNKAGKEDAGRVKAFVRNGSDTLEGEYRCPECGTEGRIKQVFNRPINIKCGKCGFLIRLPRLKGKKK
jgi:hypothetical protein